MLPGLLGRLVHRERRVMLGLLAQQVLLALRVTLDPQARQALKEALAPLALPAHKATPDPQAQPEPLVTLVRPAPPALLDLKAVRVLQVRRACRVTMAPPDPKAFKVFKASKA